MLLLAGTLPFLLSRHISPSKKFHAAAAETFATRRRFSRICFQSVTNGLRRRRRGLKSLIAHAHALISDESMSNKRFSVIVKTVSDLSECLQVIVARLGDLVGMFIESERLV